MAVRRYFDSPDFAAAIACGHAGDWSKDGRLVALPTSNVLARDVLKQQADLLARHILALPPAQRSGGNICTWFVGRASEPVQKRQHQDESAAEQQLVAAADAVLSDVDIDVPWDFKGACFLPVDAPDVMRWQVSQLYLTGTGQVHAVDTANAPAPVEKSWPEELRLGFNVHCAVLLERRMFVVTGLQQSLPAAAAAASAGASSNLLLTTLTVHLAEPGQELPALPPYRWLYQDCKALLSGFGAALDGAARIQGAAADASTGQLQLQVLLPQFAGHRRQWRSSLTEAVAAAAAAKQAPPLVSLPVVQNGAAGQRSVAVARFRLDRLDLTGDAESLATARGLTASQLWFAPP